MRSRYPASGTGARAHVKYLKFIFLFLGIALFAFVLGQTDLNQLWSCVQRVGALGACFVLGLYVFTFMTDVIGWQITFATIPPLNGRWAARLYAVRMVGEAFNNVTPTASVGGEPLKAYLLKSHYRVGYTDSSASLVLSKTTNLIGLVLFLGIGFVLLFYQDVLGGAYKAIAGAGLAGLTLITVSFFLMQRLRISSIAGSRLGRSRFGGSLTRALEFVNNIDKQFHRFYAHHPLRFGWSVLLAFLNWWIGIIEVYVVMGLLGYELSLVDAWIIESMVQLVRASTFFIPAGLGTQETVLLLVSGAITGTPVSGIAYALIRRFRELVWIGAGIGLWWFYSLRKPRAADDDVVALSDFG